MSFKITAVFIVIVLFFLLPVPSFASLVGNSNPIGYVDSANCTSFSGWAGDRDSPTTSIQVDFYTAGNYVGSTIANAVREKAVCDQMGSKQTSCTHGFIFTTPQSLKDGKPHTVYAYGINAAGTGGKNMVLTNNPQTITCIAPSPSPTFGDATINNGDVSVSTRGAYGGAITSIKYNNLEFVRTAFRGAEIQLAWQNNDAGECWNPTSDGARSDGTGPTTSAKITQFSSDAKTISESFKPAYWLHPGETSTYCNIIDGANHNGTALNTTIRSSSVVNQNITLDPEGLSNVVKLEDTITFGSTDTATNIPLNHILVEQPAVFLLTSNLTNTYRYDDSTQKALPVTSAQWASNRNQPIIISTADQITAMGIYSNQVPDTLPATWPQSAFTGYGIDYLSFPGENIWYLRIRLPYFAPMGGSSIVQGNTLSTRTYFALGSVNDVTQKLHQLYLLHPPLSKNCLTNAWKNNLEPSGCSNVQGDFNGDGHVGLDDYNFLKTVFANSSYTVFDINNIASNYGK